MSGQDDVELPNRICDYVVHLVGKFRISDNCKFAFKQNEISNAQLFPHLLVKWSVVSLENKVEMPQSLNNNR